MVCEKQTTRPRFCYFAITLQVTDFVDRSHLHVALCSRLVAEIVNISSKYSPFSIRHSVVGQHPAYISVSYLTRPRQIFPPLSCTSISAVLQTVPCVPTAWHNKSCGAATNALYKCSGKSVRSGFGVLVGLLILVMILVVSVRLHLLEEFNPEDDHANEEEHKARPRKHRLLLSGRNLLAKVFSDSAIRIVVVVLEGISQVLYKTNVVKHVLLILFRDCCKESSDCPVHFLRHWCRCLAYTYIPSTATTM